MSERNAPSSSLSTTEQIKALQEHLRTSNEAKKYPKAVEICMASLTESIRKIDRDEKLRLKFAKLQQKAQTSADESRSGVSSSKVPKLESSSCASSGNSGKQSNNRSHVDNNDGELNSANDTEEDWEDVPNNNGEYVAAMVSMDSFENENSQKSRSIVGKLLAEESVQCMSRFGIRISSGKPLSAIALALHCALVSSSVGFKCTGIPPNSKGKSSGFAAPIRELPQTQLVPNKWDANAMTHVSFRYRKDGVGTVHMEVRLDDNIGTREDSQGVICNVQMSTSNGEPLKSDPLSFALDDYVNLVALRAAASSGKDAVEPALLFKQLSACMASFVEYFDLGSVLSTGDHDIKEVSLTDDIPMMLSSAKTSSLKLSIETQSSTKRDCSPQVLVHGGVTPFRGSRESVNDMLSPKTQDDFASDLLPGGTKYPGIPISGNLMGPSHPMFLRRGGDDPNTNMPDFGGLGMRPRYDPVMPPGMEVSFDKNGNLTRRSDKKMPLHRGEPNNDHMRPPNSFTGSNMFL